MNDLEDIPVWDPETGFLVTASWSECGCEMTGRTHKPKGVQRRRCPFHPASLIATVTVASKDSGASIELAEWPLGTFALKSRRALELLRRTREDLALCAFGTFVPHDAWTDRYQADCGRKLALVDSLIEAAERRPARLARPKTA